MERSKPRARVGAGAKRIEEVARIAGVSPTTVSRTVNQPETVSESTRNAVWAAIEQIGYIPNRLAGGLASNKSKTIGMILPHIDHSTFAARVQGMTDVLHREGYTLMLALCGFSPEIELEHVIGFLGQRVAGLTLTGTSHADRTRALLAKAGIPTVEFSTISAQPIDMLVGFSNEGACYAMVEYLARCGYRKIALVSGSSTNNDRTAARQEGYRKAVRELGLVNDETLIYEMPVGLSAGAQAFVELLGRHPDLEAVFCTNDALAVGCMLEARRRGIDIPGDIGVAGFDDVELAQEFVPAVTTVRVKRYEIGAIAGQLLLQRIRGETPERLIVDTGFEIVARSSTRRPKS